MSQDMAERVREAGRVRVARGCLDGAGPWLRAQWRELLRRDWVPQDDQCVHWARNPYTHPEDHRLVALDDETSNVEVYVSARHSVGQAAELEG